MLSPHGSWKSPISSDLIVAQTIGISSVTSDGEDIYWLEARPQEKGRNVLVRLQPDGSTQDITPSPFNVRTRVHEYGGGAYLITEGIIYFSNYEDQRLYQQTPHSQPIPLTPKDTRRYADFILDAKRNRLIAVAEDHATQTEPENSLVTIDLTTGSVQTLVKGHDFYSSPRLSADGSTLAWLTWDHPYMPWDSSQLSLAHFNPDGSLGEITPIAGGGSESICEPRWSPEGKLYFSSDRNDWWNLYGYSQGNITPLYEYGAEFAYPHWVFGLSNYGFVSESLLICSYTQNGRWYLARLDTETKQLQEIDTNYTDIGSLSVSDNQVLFIGGSPLHPTSVVRLDLSTHTFKELKKSSDLEIDKGYLSTPEALSFPTENGLTAHAWYYPPQNKDYTGSDLPPLLVKSHGGPTASASSSFNLRIQYWTSRGFAYLDVNYGGSTGYGRAYRQRLQKNWGIVDVQDCINGAKYLVKAGKVASEHLAISGGSAGGYTTLAALTFYDTFKAGASYYGISDLEALAQDTHKFESRYLDGLIGLYPQEQELYYQRSPINFTDSLSCPVIFFQGLEDAVVPPNQAQRMVDVLQKKGLPVAYLAFEGEQHGFRKAENIKRALDGEFYFYSRIFGFPRGSEIKPVEIFNLSTER